MSVILVVETDATYAQGISEAVQPAGGDPPGMQYGDGGASTRSKAMASGHSGRTSSQSWTMTRWPLLLTGRNSVSP